MGDRGARAALLLDMTVSAWRAGGMDLAAARRPHAGGRREQRPWEARLRASQGLSAGSSSRDPQSNGHGAAKYRRPSRCQPLISHKTAIGAFPVMLIIDIRADRLRLMIRAE